jgi:DNA polymerase III gamma/tau subunit
MSLYEKYRPNSFSKVQGTARHIGKLIESKSNNHAFLFIGGSGVGKTTVARLIAQFVGASSNTTYEINCGDSNGVDYYRELILSLKYKSDTPKVFILDEVHKLTTQSQNALLKPLEDISPNTYFILCTTEPQNILPTIMTRCIVKKFPPLTEEQLYSILRDIRNDEGMEIGRDELEKIAKAANGSARRAINILEVVENLPLEERSGEISNASLNVENGAGVAKDLCEILYYNKGSYIELCSILSSLRDNKEDPEAMRRFILGYGQNCLLSNSKKRKESNTMIEIMKFFIETTFNTGFPGLVLNCLEAYKYSNDTKEVF